MASNSPSLSKEEINAEECPVNIQNNFVSFQTKFFIFIMGCIINTPMAVLLIAAHKIIHSAIDKLNYKNDFSFNKHQCSAISETILAVIIADILPSILARASVWLPSFTMMVLILLFYSVGAVIIGNTQIYFFAIAGVALISMATGLGEVTLIPIISSYKNKNAVFAWSSGRINAGLIGSLFYTLSTTFASESIFLTSLSSTPILMGLICACFIIPKKRGEKMRRNIEAETCSKTFFQILKDCPSLLWFTMLLAMKDLIERLIISGLIELIPSVSDSLIYDQQHPWFLIAFQAGLFITILPISTWVLVLLQVIPLILGLIQCFYTFMKTFYFVLLILYLIGVCAGLIHEKTLDKICEKVSPANHEFVLNFTFMCELGALIVAVGIYRPPFYFIC